MKCLSICIAAALTLSGCAASKSTYTRAGNYPKMYAQKRASIVVMPPINKTVSVEAKEFFYYTMNAPLCEAGYYVVSPFLAMELFKSESAYDSELFVDRGDLGIFGRVFGADAVLFTVINAWDKSKAAGVIAVEMEYILRSVETGEVLFRRSGDVTVDTSVDTGDTGLIGALIGMVATALSTTEAGKVRAARNCNYYIFRDIPRGPYDPHYGTDGQFEAGTVDVSSFEP